MYIEYEGIKYKKPKVKILQDTGLGVSEIAARTCYNSFDKSNNSSIKEFSFDNESKEFNNIETSELLENLAWVYQHHSILEHINISFFIKDVSRGVLQEHARHRIQAISVKSTRYTMSDIINAFNVIYFGRRYSINTNEQKKAAFITFMETLNLDFLVTVDKEYNKIEYRNIFEKLLFQVEKIGKDNFLKLSTSKEMRDKKILEDYVDEEETYKELLKCKQKRNVGDPFKHIVNDNWSTNMVITFNMRSLKNYFNLRDSGAAYFQIQALAKEMKKQLPKKYLFLIERQK